VLAAGDVFVQPSRSEGLPLAVLEAMAHGLPVVASRVGGIPEAVAEGKTGFLVPPGEPDALAKALARVLDADDRGAALGQRGARARGRGVLGRAHGERYRALYLRPARTHRVNDCGAPARVLVTDGEMRAALACVRALAARGHTVHVAASGARSLAAASRHATAVHAIGDPNEDPRGYADRLARAASEMRADLILPVTR
jgi:hypothetical protein